MGINHYYPAMDLEKLCDIYHGILKFCGVTRSSLSSPSPQPFLPDLSFCSDLGSVSDHKGHK